MPMLIHDITSYFIEHERDLFYLGPKDQGTLSGSFDDAFEGYDQWQRDLEKWSARHLPGVETFPLAPAGWLAGAPPHLGLEITPAQVDAFAAEHECETGESRDSLVQMYAMQFSTWRAKVARYAPRLQRTTPGRDTMFWVSPHGIVAAQADPRDWDDALRGESGEGEGESDYRYWSPRVVWYLARGIEPAWAETTCDAFPSGSLVREGDSPGITLYVRSGLEWFNVPENLAQVCAWFGIEPDSVKVEDAEGW
ncbi:MAG TPA: hypothetical protein VFN29_04810 [Chiayiivirga sp.]|nr:hypothetical protein [Chiayiivirga sp.]